MLRRHMGEWRYGSTFLNLGTKASRPGSFNSRERTPGTHRVVSWVGRNVGPIAVEISKILHCRELKPNSAAFSPSLYTLS
jgi:hypothetical protein